MQVKKSTILTKTGGGVGGGGDVTECICTLCLCCCMYSVCRSVGVLSCVSHSIFYVCVTCCDLDVTIGLSGTVREKARGNNNDLLYVPSKRKGEIKSGTSGCGSFVVPYFQPATSTDCLHLCRKKMHNSDQSAKDWKVTDGWILTLPNLIIICSFICHYCTDSRLIVMVIAVRRNSSSSLS